MCVVVVAMDTAGTVTCVDVCCSGCYGYSRYSNLC